MYPEKIMFFFSFHGNFNRFFSLFNCNEKIALKKWLFFAYLYLNQNCDFTDFTLKTCTLWGEHAGR